MKKITRTALIIMAMVITLSFSAFAENDSGINQELPKTEMVLEVEEDPDELLQRCPKCGNIHDGCCEDCMHLLERTYNEVKEWDYKQNALYFVTAENQLILINLKTKQSYEIAESVKGVIRIGMNGRYIGYVTLEGEAFIAPYEIGEDGNLVDFLNQ